MRGGPTVDRRFCFTRCVRLSQQRPPKDSGRASSGLGPREREGGRCRASQVSTQGAFRVFRGRKKCSPQRYLGLDRSDSARGSWSILGHLGFSVVRKLVWLWSPRYLSDATPTSDWTESPFARDQSQKNPSLSAASEERRFLEVL